MWSLHFTVEKCFICVAFLAVLTIFAVIIAENDGLSQHALLHSNLSMEAGHSVLNIQSEVARSAESLAREVRVLCLVMTHPGNHKTRALKVY